MEKIEKTYIAYISNPRTFVEVVKGKCTEYTEELEEVSTRDEEEFNSWLKKKKAPTIQLDGQGVYSTGRKVWKKIVKAEVLTRVTTESVEEIKL